MTDSNYPLELMRLVNAFQVSQAIHVAATLGIADLLAKQSQTTEELAAKTKTDAGALYRLLRALAAVGVFQEEAGRRFTLTPLGVCLRSDAPIPVSSWAAFVGRPYFWQAWGHLLYSVRTGENAFKHVHGVDVWGYRSQHPEEGPIFDAAMTALSQQVSNAVVAAYDFAQCRRVVDVGGGHGAFLAAILAANPAVSGILFDQPHVVAGAGSLLQGAGVTDRCDVRGGSFFECVPEGGDAYVMKSVLHDWNDPEATQILRACRAATPMTAKLLVIEQVVAAPNEGLVGKMSDLNMLVGPGGRERTADEFGDLFTRAGFRLTSVIPTASRFNVIEGTPVQGPA